MIGIIKRAITTGMVALTLLGGGLALADDAAAYSRTYRSDDGKVVFICHYDDRSNDLAFCDVFYFPVVAEASVMAY